MSQKPFTENAANEDQLKDAHRKQKNQREIELNDLRHVLSNPQGRRFVWRLLAKTGLYKTSIEPSGSMVYANEGRRDIGLFVMHEINEARPEAYLEMMLEAKERKS